MPFEGTKPRALGSVLHQAIQIVLLIQKQIIIHWLRAVLQSLKRVLSCHLLPYCFNERCWWPEYGAFYIHSMCSIISTWHLLPSHQNMELSLELSAQFKLDTGRCLPTHLETLPECPCLALVTIVSKSARTTLLKSFQCRGNKNKMVASLLPLEGEARIPLVCSKSWGSIYPLDHRLLTSDM